MANTKYFYLSGFISLSFFLLFLFSFIYMGFVSQNVKQYALQEDNYVSIILQTPDITLSKDSSIVEEESVTQPEDVDVSDLFSDVWTKKLPKKSMVKKVIKRVDNTVIKKLNKKIKKLKIEKSKKIIREIPVSITKKKKQTSAKKTRNIAREVNEYLAKINIIIYQYFNPPKDSQGHSVQTVIVLSSFGKVLDFRILRYSSNQGLNDECDHLKQRLKNIVFPINPKSQTSRTKIILTSKE